MTEIDPDYFYDDAEAASVNDSIERSEGSRDAFMFAAGASLGSMYADQEFDDMEPETADDDEVEKIPLSERFATAINKKSRPVVRWLMEVRKGTKKPTDPITYTAEEMMLILEQEGLDE